LTGFTERYEERATNGSYDIINQAYKLYDVLWILALALNSTDAMIKKEESNVTMTECENATGTLVPLEDFDYSNELMGCVIRWNIQQTHRFYGLTVS
jgi:aspartate aminotransferase-like enzyme